MLDLKRRFPTVVPVISLADSSHFDVVNNPRGWVPETKDMLKYLSSFSSVVLDRKIVILMNPCGRSKFGRLTHKLRADNSEVKDLTSPLELTSGLHGQLISAMRTLKWKENKVKIYMYVGGETLTDLPDPYVSTLEDIYSLTNNVYMTAGIDNEFDYSFIFDDIGDCSSNEYTITHTLVEILRLSGFGVGFEPSMRQSTFEGDLNRKFGKPNFYCSLSQRTSASWIDASEDKLISPVDCITLTAGEVSYITLVLGNKSNDPMFPTLDTVQKRITAAKDHIFDCEKLISPNDRSKYIVGITMSGLSTDDFFKEFGRMVKI